MLRSRRDWSTHLAVLVALLCPATAGATTPAAAPPPDPGGAVPASGAPNAPGAAQSAPAAKDTDCALGALVWCFIESERYRGGAPSAFRIEGFGGYKFSNMYYRDEIRGCDEAGCEIDFKGPSFGLDAYYNVKGDPRSDDYLAVGLAASYLPIVSEIRKNTAGFRGELGQIRAGDGTLGYVPIRLSIRRASFLYLIKSKYMISAFGVGLALPVHSGSGETFTGASSPKITLGGKLGAELPIADPLKLGLATNWSVIWYGSTFGESSFSSAYGLNLTYLL